MNDAWIQSAAFKHPSFAREKERRLVISPFILNEFAVEPRYHVSAGRIKKYYPLDLNRMCGRLGLHMSELFGEIIIGPTSSQSIPILQDYLVDCGLNSLKNKISMSDCPLRKPISQRFVETISISGSTKDKPIWELTGKRIGIFGVSKLWLAGMEMLGFNMI